MIPNKQTNKPQFRVLTIREEIYVSGLYIRELVLFRWIFFLEIGSEIADILGKYIATAVSNES